MKKEKYKRFAMVLMVTHDCNLRCSYCYSGKKSQRRMSFETAKETIDRGIASTEEGGVFELSFFGGEPLLEIDLIEKVIDYTSELTEENNIDFKMSITTNGTLLNGRVMKLFCDQRIQVSVSCDGIPEIHDLNRKDKDKMGSSSQVYKTIDYLRSRDIDFTVVSVVTPNNVEKMQENILFLKQKGVRYIELNLDLWSSWNDSDISNLSSSIRESVILWKANLPYIGITWFDEKLLMMTGNYQRDTCRFGNGDIAISPSGRLYPCERLIGDDDNSNTMRIDDDLFSEEDFLSDFPAPERSCDSCTTCNVDSMCATDCRCSNYVRSGDVAIPDKLLCMKEKECLTQVIDVFK